MKKPFKLKYKNSAFPFKGSPVKELQTESGESVVEVDNEGSGVEQENIKKAKEKVLINWEMPHASFGMNPSTYKKAPSGQFSSGVNY